MTTSGFIIIGWHPEETMSFSSNLLLHSTGPRFHVAVDWSGNILLTMVLIFCSLTFPQSSSLIIRKIEVKKNSWRTYFATRFPFYGWNSSVSTSVYPSDEITSILRENITPTQRFPSHFHLCPHNMLHTSITGSGSRLWLLPDTSLRKYLQRHGKQITLFKTPATCGRWTI